MLGCVILIEPKFKGGNQNSVNYSLNDSLSSNQPVYLHYLRMGVDELCPHGTAKKKRGYDIPKMRCATSSSTKNINVYYFIVKATRTLSASYCVLGALITDRSDWIAYVEPSLYLNHPSPNQPLFFRWYIRIL